jgi:hypothetical protein
MKRVKRILKYSAMLTSGVLLSLIAFGSAPAFAQDANHGVPGDWLSRYSGARSVGLGGAFVAISDEPIGAVWNPAGLSSVMQYEIHFEQTRLFEGTKMNGMGVVFPFRTFPTLGLSVITLGSDEFERTSELNEPLGTFKESDQAFLLSASKQVHGRVAVGANVKIVRQQIEDFDAAGVGADLGVMVDVTPRLRLGASLLNMGGPTVTLREVDETFPFEFRGGMAFKFFGGRGLLSVEMDHRSGPGMGLHTGGEVWVLENVALRGGYHDTDPSGGLSYHFNDAMRFDYGVSDQELGVVHRFGISYRFGGFFASSNAHPEVFSPIGERSVTKFQMKTRTKDDAERWRLDIWDKHDQVVRSFGGTGVPPAHVMWDGKDETGLTLPDGVYRYRLVVTDEAGRIVRASEKKVQISTSGPTGSVPVLVD